MFRKVYGHATGTSSEKAAEHCRTPKRYRAILRRAFWSAAVLCRFFGRIHNRQLYSRHVTSAVERLSPLGTAHTELLYFCDRKLLL
jgi:hypothetical protein